MALRENRVLLTADSGILKRNLITRGRVKALYVPRDMPRDRQVATILSELKLPRRPPRCMACGGQFIVLDQKQAKCKVPPGAYGEHQQFYECTRCGKVYWHGSHWTSIDRRLNKLGLELKD